VNHTGRCRSCNAPIVWAVSAAKGNRMPLDPDPVPDGNVWIIERPEHGAPIVGVTLHHDDLPEGTLTYVSHFVTCRDADKWRKREKW